MPLDVCADHEIDAITDATLLSSEKLAAGYHVTAHRVDEDEEGFATLGRSLFTVRRRTSVGG